MHATFLQKYSSKKYGEQKFPTLNLKENSFLLLSSRTQGLYDFQTENMDRDKLIYIISKEIIENFIPKTLENPIIAEITNKLEEEFKTKLFFDHPPFQAEMRILKEIDGKFVAVDEEEKANIIKKLWEITYDIIDKSTSQLQYETEKEKLAAIEKEELELQKLEENKDEDL